MVSDASGRARSALFRRFSRAARPTAEAQPSVRLKPTGRGAGIAKPHPSSLSFRGTYLLIETRGDRR